MRRRQQKTKQAHYCLLVNKQAANYSASHVKRLTHAIKKRRGAYTVLEPDSAMETLKLARMAAGVARDKRVGLLQTRLRGRVTALVACGGDGTANLVARAAVQADMPMGILPLGRHNNIARSLCGSDEPEAVLPKITKMVYRQIDTAAISGQMFFGSIGIGYFPELMELLDGVKPPRFGFQWAKLGGRIAAAVRPRKMIIKVDSFRFEVRPHILQVNLLPYTAGLNLNPASIVDDNRAEIIFDVGADAHSKKHGATWSDHLRKTLASLSRRTPPTWTIGTVEAFVMAEVNFSKSSQLLSGQELFPPFFDVLVDQVKLRNPNAAPGRPSADAGPKPLPTESPPPAP